MSEMPDTNDPRELFNASLRVPRNQSIDLLERAEQGAEAAGDDVLLTNVRLRLCSAYGFSAHPARMLRPATWLARQVQAGAPWLEARQRRSILWDLKWVAPRLTRVPTVSRTQIESYLDLMRDLYASAGQGLQPVHAAQYYAASALDGESEATPAYERWLASPRTNLSDCAACEAHARAEHFVRLGRPDEAVRVGEELIEGSASCAEQPQFGQALLLLPLLQDGAPDRARAALRAAWPKLRSDPSALAEVGEILEALALTGNLDRALELWSTRIRQLADPPSPQDAMLFAARGARLCRALVDAGRGELPVSGSDGSSVPASQQADILTGLARDLAARFDERNGNSHVSDEVEQILDRASLPAVDLSGAPGHAPGRGVASATPPEFSYPRQGLWAMAPSGRDVAVMDARGIAAVAEDAVRLGSTSDRMRLAARWLQVDGTDLDPVTRARTCEWLYGDAPTPAHSEALLTAAEQAWREAGDPGRADALLAVRLARAGEAFDAFAVDARLQEHGGPLDQALPLPQLVPLLENPAVLQPRIGALLEQLGSATAEERVVRAQLRLLAHQIELAVGGGANAGTRTPVDLGLGEDEFPTLQLGARILALHERLTAGVDEQGLAEATEECRRLVRDAHRAGAVHPWVGALETLARLHLAVDDTAAAEACLRAASSAEALGVDPDTGLPLLLLLAQVQANGGRLVEAADTAGRALALSEDLPAVGVGLRMAAAHLAGRLEIDLGNRDRGIELLRTALASVGEQDDPAASIEVRHDLGVALAGGPQQLEARDLQAAAIEDALDPNSGIERSDVFDWLVTLAGVTDDTDGTDAALGVLDRAEALLAAGLPGVDPLMARTMLQLQRAGLRAQAEQFQQARDEVAGLADELAARGDREQELHVRVLDARMQLELADPSDADAGDALLALAITCRDEGFRDDLWRAVNHLYRWHWGNGRGDRAEELDEQFEDR